MLEYIESFSKKEYYVDRMISHSKSRYRKKYPFNKVYFNANIFILKNDKPLKIWHGDIDLSLEGDIIKEISKNLGEKLFIVSEMDGRFGEEDSVNLMEKSIWDTGQLTPFLTESDLERLKKEREEQILESKKEKKERDKQEIEENKQYPIKEPLEGDYQEKIEIPYDLIKKELADLKKKLESKNIKNVHRNQGEIFEEYFSKYGYFTAKVLDQFLSKKYNVNVENNEIIDPCQIWLSNKTNAKLVEIDLEAERLFDKNFKKEDFKRDVTCNYCVEPICFLNKDKKNQDSYEEDILYVRKGEVKKEWVWN